MPRLISTLIVRLFHVLKSQTLSVKFGVPSLQLPNFTQVPIKKILHEWQIVHSPKRRVHHVHKPLADHAFVRQLRHRPNAQHIKRQNQPRNPHPPEHTAPTPRLISTLAVFFVRHFGISNDCRRRREETHITSHHFPSASKALIDLQTRKMPMASIPTTAGRSHLLSSSKKGEIRMNASPIPSKRVGRRYRPASKSARENTTGLRFRCHRKTTTPTTALAARVNWLSVISTAYTKSEAAPCPLGFISLGFFWTTYLEEIVSRWATDSWRTWEVNLGFGIWVLRFRPTL
jgi:hypothetical protein